MDFNSIIFLLIFGIFCEFSYGVDHAKNELDSTLVPSIQLYEKVNETTITALGRIATFGDLYDARTEKFLGFNIFKKPVQPTRDEGTPNSGVTFTMQDSYTKKFQNMDIEAHLKVSVMSGMVDVTGAGKFFKDFQKTTKSRKGVIIQHITTRKTSVQMNNQDVKDNIDEQVLMELDATHVVVGIHWGGSLFLSVEDENTDDKDVQEIGGNLEVVIKKLMVDVQGSANLQYNDSEIEQFDRYSFELYGDILTDKLPQVILDAVEVMRDAPKTLRAANDNKGKPIRYVLMDINSAREILGRKTRQAFVQQINDQIIQDATTLFDAIQGVEKRINELHSLAKLFGNYIDQSIVEKIEKFYLEFNANKIRTQMQLCEALVKFRSGQGSGEDIVKVMNGFCTTCYEKRIEEFQPLKEDISFIRSLNTLGVKVLSKHDYLQQFLWTNFNKDVYILFYNPNDLAGSLAARKPFSDLLQNAKVNHKDDAMFAAIDTSVIRVNQNRFIHLSDENSKVTYFKHGQIMVENYHPNDKIPEEQKDLMSLHEMRTQVAALHSRPAVPSGYVYIQYPDASSPQKLWPDVKWQDESYRYEGRFFRALSDETAKWNDFQSENKANVSLRYVYIVNEPWQLSNYQVISKDGRGRRRPEFWQTQPHCVDSVSDQSGRSYYNLEVTEQTQGYRLANYATKIWVAE